MEFELSNNTWDVSEVAAVFQTVDSRLHGYGHNVSSKSVINIFKQFKQNLHQRLVYVTP